MFRMYAIPNCAFCEGAKSFLKERGVYPEVINPPFDPIINSGLAIMFPGQPPQFPVLVSFEANQILVGFKEDDYIQLFNTLSGTGLSDGSTTGQQPAEQAPIVVEEQTPETEGAA